jgi:predicted O-methyltransferase YrrM
MEKMIADPENYFKRFIPSRTSLLKHLEQEALTQEIPIVGPVVGELLYILVRVCGAKRILELGTATGYSGIFLAQACEETDGQLTTIEMSPGLALRAQRNFEKSGLEHRVDIRLGECQEVMAEMQHQDEPYDFIFMDIDKEYYGPVLPICQRLLKPGGLLLADNTGFNDAREFNKMIVESGEWRSVHLYAFLPQHSPEHDALCLALRI